MKISALLLLLAATAACSDDAEGIQVAVTVAGQTLPANVTASGGTAALDASYVTVVGFEIEPCESVARTLWRAVNPLPSAFAHGEASPTSLAVPVVIGIAGSRPEVAVGTLEPPPDRYCGMTLAIGAADDDAVGLPDDDMVGKSLRVAGTMGATSFNVSSAANGHAHVQFASPLTLSADRAEARLTVSLDTSDAFNAVDFGAVSAAADIMTGLEAGFTVSVQ